MAQISEPSLLDYARFHGLAHDHRETYPLAGLGQIDHFVGQDENPPEDFPFDDSNASLPAEKICFEKNAMPLLAWIRRSLSEEPSPFDGGTEFNVHRFGQLRLDPPLLRTDHEWDMIGFGHQVVPDLENEFLPLETVDEEADEGFTWPSKYNSLPDTFFEKCNSETLLVSNEVLVYLRDVMRKCADDNDLMSFDDEGLLYTKSTTRGPVTPPLLPLSPPFLPFVPSSDTGKLELLSDHSSPTRQQLLEIDRMLSDKDGIFSKKRKRETVVQDLHSVSLEASNIEDIYSPLKGMQDLPSSPPVKRRSLQDRKVEVPLSPLACELPLPAKTKKVTFSEALLTAIPDLPPAISKNDDGSSDDIETFFNEIVAPIGLKAERSIEQEQLQAADTELRVPIPIMDFSRPEVPWKTLKHTDIARCNDSYKKTMLDLKQTYLSKSVWPAIGRSERELRWNPFLAHASKFEPQDTFSDDGSADKFVEQPECIDSETMTWKPDGLRILDDLGDMDDEKLELGEFPAADDTNALIYRRKLELEEEDDSATAMGDYSHLKPRLGKDFDTAGQLTEVAAVNAKLAYLKNHFEKPSNLLTTSFSAVDELENFICIRNGESRKPKVITDERFPAKLPKDNRDTSQENSVVRLSAEMKPNPSMAKLSIPAPQFTVPSISRPFIVSNFFLRDRKLSRRIQNLYPSAEFIERNFTLYSSRGQATTFGKPPAFQPVDNLINEADMILSPSTGLIWTTLLKIKQRSLPGQTAKSALRENIAQAAPRYERLLILISQSSELDIASESASEATLELTDSDCEAIVEFVGFCATLQQDTQAFFVAGGKEHLANWIVAMMVKYGVTDPEINLTPDETSWELFLRRAGMNAFAAQALLAALKPPDPNFRLRPTEFGLGEFVKMSIDERLARFEGLLGGRSLLQRVSAWLDAQW